MIVMNLVIIFVFILAFILPLVIAVNSDSVSEAGVYNTILISGSLTMILMLVILLITDFARSWKTANKGRGPFMAISAGFRLGFRNLPASFLFMLIIVLMQLIPAVAGYMIISSPAEGKGIFALFMSTQLLFFIKIALRIWRYAGITAIMELYRTQISIPVRTEPVIIDEKPENDYII
jgi:hypothetical protein